MKKDDSISSFTPPRHWIGPEELEASYWESPQALERRAQEFHDKPIETLELIERMDSKGIARRDFLTIMSASMAMAGFACARRPVHKIIPYVVQPEDLTEGVASYFASTCPETGAGVLIKTREGRPIKLEGNPSHPLNQGRLSARGQSAVLDLYDVDRLKEPMAQARGQTSAQAVAWAEVDSAVVAKLKSAYGKVRVLSGFTQGDSLRRLTQEFLGGANLHVEFETSAFEEIADSQAQCYGTAVVPAYHFDQADVVVSLGADFLGTWLSPVEHAADWAKTRKLVNGKLSQLITFESMLSLTGSNSDHRFAVRPGDELKIALALAKELGAQFPNSAEYTLKAVSADTEVPVDRLKWVAKLLSDSRGRSLVVGGGFASKSGSDLALQIAVNLLNSTLGNEGMTVDGTTQADFRPVASYSRIEKLISDMKSGAVEVLIIHGTNPAYTLSSRSGFEDALKNVGLVVAVSDRIDETAALADYVLPDHHFLENWGDAHPRKNLYSLQQPAIAPIHGGRSFEDTLLVWSKASGRASALGAKSETWHDYLMANWKESVFAQAGRGSSFEKFWETALRAGVVEVSKGGRGTTRSLRPTSLAELPKFTPKTQLGLTMALYSKVSMGDGRSANNPWLQEMPDPISTITWDNYLNLAPKTAAALGLAQDDVAEVKVGDHAFELPVNVQVGLHPGVATCAIGYGRKRAGNVGNDAGISAYQWVQAQASRRIYSGMPVEVKKTGKFYRLAATQWHNLSENRPIINDITLAEYKKDPGTTNHTNAELKPEDTRSIWAEHEYKGYRWGMAIDLNSCTGCGACVIGCQAENNIPVVGRKNVRVSRQMHWIRIDRYYTSTHTGSTDQPEVIFQPMLCQHCENAPCETVCPVLATVHDSEGTSNQAYNRCVGTRYCQNNCPYKVRRFNFFDHWKAYEGTMNLVWNPDVTVRTRGIMEKCSFCIQRINGGKDKAKDEGRRVTDGNILTACQQTCPTDAIVFGDINDPKSRVSKLRENPRAFRSLEILNTKPSISYLTKVRNKEGHSHV